MVRAIMKDVLFLKKKAVPATKDDMPVVQDLLDTLKANETGCVGMAANMIGVKNYCGEYGICEYCNVKSGDCK